MSAFSYSIKFLYLWLQYISRQRQQDRKLKSIRESNKRGVDSLERFYLRRARKELANLSTVKFEWLSGLSLFPHLHLLRISPQFSFNILIKYPVKLECLFSVLICIQWRYPAGLNVVFAWFKMSPWGSFSYVLFLIKLKKFNQTKTTKYLVMFSIKSTS